MMTVRVLPLVAKIKFTCDMVIFFLFAPCFQSLLYITFTHNSEAFKFYIIPQANKLRMLFKKSKQTFNLVCHNVNIGVYSNIFFFHFFKFTYTFLFLASTGDAFVHWTRSWSETKRMSSKRPGRGTVVSLWYLGYFIVDKLKSKKI